MTRGAATITINCVPNAVFDVVTDVSLMGEWSPECTGGEWVSPATGPATGAEFLGHNAASLGPIPLKKWTTTSKVTECVRGQVFEFLSEGYTTWRYEFVEVEGMTRVTESFSHAPYTGFQKFIYGTIAKRTPSMVTGMEATLAALKAAIEADPNCAVS